MLSAKLEEECYGVEEEVGMLRGAEPSDEVVRERVVSAANALLDTEILDPPRTMKRKRLMVTKTPATIALHINRRVFTRVGGMTKDRTAILVTKYFSLETFVGPVTYLVNAVIAHRGSESSGHFVCYKLWGGRWWNCSDERVTECQFDDWSGGDVYMVFGSRIAQAANLSG